MSHLSYKMIEKPSDQTSPNTKNHIGSVVHVSLIYPISPEVLPLRAVLFGSEFQASPGPPPGEMRTPPRPGSPGPQDQVHRITNPHPPGAGAHDQAPQAPQAQSPAARCCQNQPNHSQIIPPHHTSTRYRHPGSRPSRV